MRYIVSSAGKALYEGPSFKRARTVFEAQHDGELVAGIYRIAVRKAGTRVRVLPTVAR